jgi:uncharacterized protein (TIGR00297 family)
MEIELIAILGIIDIVLGFAYIKKKIDLSAIIATGLVGGLCLLAGGAKWLLPLLGGAVGIFAAIAIVTDHPTLYIAVVATMAVALADTTATELGQVFGKNPVLITTLEKVPIGTPGAVTKEGLLFFFLGSGIIASLLLIGQHGVIIFLFITNMGFLGVILNSYLGATSEGYRYINTHYVNFLTTTFIGSTAMNIYTHLL